MASLYSKKDNEFVAWYPPALSTEGAATVWQPRRAGYYVHIPFCTAICDYCGFAVAREKGANVQRYLSALHQEIDRYVDSGRLANYRFECGHFGGGTPSILPASDLLSIKQKLDKHLNVDPTAEVTVEVNPISFTLEKAYEYHAGGINRISFGLQSFHDHILKTIGRGHRRQDIENTLKIIQQVGWDNYSLDLIYGVPGQTIAELRADLLNTVETGASHISCFRLEIIPFTVLALRQAANMLPARLSDEMLNEMDNIVAETLSEYGYEQYGAFNFARAGYKSIHNEIAFVAPQGEYVGFGNSAYSYINQHIYCNHARLPNYEEAIFSGRDPIAFAKKLNSLEAMSRYFVLGLKFFRVQRAPFVAEFGQEPEQVFGEILEHLQGEGMLVREDDAYCVTAQGRHYINNICKEFYVGEHRGQRQHIQFVPTLTVSQINYYAEKAQTHTLSAPS